MYSEGLSEELRYRILTVFSNLQRYAKRSGELFAGCNLSFGKHIHNGELNRRDYLVRFFGKFKHGGERIRKAGSCYFIVFCFGRGVQADGQGVDNSDKIRDNIPSVLQTAKTIGVDTDRDTVVFSGILCCFKKNIQPAGWFSIAAIYKFIISGEVKGIHSGFDFFSGRIFFVPECFGVADAVLVASDTEGAAAIAAVCNIRVNLIFVSV